MKIIISGKKVFRIIVIIIGVLVFLSIIGQISVHFFEHKRLLGFVELFHLERENNFPTFFQTTLIFFSALIIFFILKFNITKEKIPKHYWITLLIMFLYMGTDEIVGLHEKITYIIEKIYGYQMHGFLYFPWVIIGIIIALVFIIYFSFLIIKIDKKIRRMLIISAFLYLFGEIIVEMISGFYADKFGMDFTYQLLVTLEESTAMFGIAIFIKTLIKYINLKITNASFNIIFK